MSTDAANLIARVAGRRYRRAMWSRVVDRGALDRDERQRAAGYPISRWYLRPLAAVVAQGLAPTRLRPFHLTCCGLAANVAAGVAMFCGNTGLLLAALLVLLAWFFDRADGILARCQQTATVFGAWFDANVDELADVALHTAAAAVLATQTATAWPWWLLIAFVGGKYLFMHGLMFEAQQTAQRQQTGQREDTPLSRVGRGAGGEGKSCSGGKKTLGFAQKVSSAQNDNADSPEVMPSPPRTSRPRRLLRQLYHLPANADIRTHLFVVALATGCLAAELALVATYYNVRWIARYVLVARRLGGVR